MKTPTDQLHRIFKAMTKGTPIKQDKGVTDTLAQCFEDIRVRHASTCYSIENTANLITEKLPCILMMLLRNTYFY